jgi:phosphoribosyl 1,2-cyclic phosphodiesterase
MKVCVLGSGSSGNCIFISGRKTKILVDLGLSPLRVEKSLRALGETTEGISVIVTHAHSDHVSGIEKFCQKHAGVKVYCHADCYEGVSCKIGSAKDKLCAVSGDFFVEEVTVTPIRVSHDVPCVGYSFLCEGKKITVATDIGKMSSEMFESMSDSDLVVIESNHDETLLLNNDAYSYPLKRRILSDKGHLSNASCAECVAKLARLGVKQFVLAHLSRENNYPELAFETTKEKLLCCGLCEGEHFTLEIAEQDRMSSLFEIL